MKTILKGLLVLFGLTSSMVSAARFLGEEDDTYIGFQITTSLRLDVQGVIFRSQPI